MGVHSRPITDGRADVSVDYPRSSSPADPERDLRSNRRAKYLNRLSMPGLRKRSQASVFGLSSACLMMVSVDYPEVFAMGCSASTRRSSGWRCRATPTTAGPPGEPRALPAPRRGRRRRPRPARDRARSPRGQGLRAEPPPHEQRDHPGPRQEPARRVSHPRSPAPLTMGGRAPLPDEPGGFGALPNEPGGFGALPNEPGGVWGPSK